MNKYVRHYEITIESTEDEQTNLQRFLLECHRLSIQCFHTASLGIMNGASLVQPLSDPALPLIPGSTEL